MIRMIFAGVVSVLICFSGKPPVNRFLYVAEDQGWIYVYDIDKDHKLVKKFEVEGTGEFKGICADPVRGKLYLSSYVNDQLVCVDLATEKIEWKLYIPGYPDSPAITPDGKYIYMPKRYSKFWDVVDTDLRKVITSIEIPYGNPHNTWCSNNGKTMYLAALGNENLYVADTRTHKIVSSVGPFEPNADDPWSWTQKKHNGPKGIRPFAISKDDRFAYVNLDGILGYQVGDIRSGKKIASVEVKGFETLRGNHLTTSHGINITPDQKEIWISNDAGPYVHVFDCTVTPHRQIADIKLNHRNGWITFGIDGRYAYPSSGDVIDTRTKKIVASVVESEKLLEIQFESGKVARVGTR